MGAKLLVHLARAGAAFFIALLLIGISALTTANGSAGVGPVPVGYWPATTWIFVDLLPHALSIGLLFVLGDLAHAVSNRPNGLQHDVEAF